MKSRIILIVSGLLLLSTWSCEDYLDKVEASDLTEEDVFGTYIDYQGFADQMYELIVAYMNQNNNCSYNYGDHVAANTGGMPSGAWDQGQYWDWDNYDGKTIFVYGGNNNMGIWDGGWKGIRIANQCIENIDYLVEATDEQRDLILGQAYFFRAFFHWEIIRAFGGLPYIEASIQASDDMKFARLSYQESTDKIADDMDMAIGLLPLDWDLTETGALTVGANRGRATKGAAIAIKSKALLYAASPLMNNESTGSGYVYNHDILDESAEAAHEFLKLVTGGTYKLEDFANYTDIFYRMDGSVTWGGEIIWQRTAWSGKEGFAGYKNQGVGRLIMGGVLGQVQNCEAPTENLVELFEMAASGLPVDDPASGFNPLRPWEGRDPRFYEAILTDSTRWVKKFPDTSPNAYLHLYNGGVHRGTQGSMTGYFIKKYWPYGVNAIDKDFKSFRFRNPILRVAEVYLNYAEAVNEVYGPAAAPTFNGETGLTALEAINIVRNRAGMPDVHSKFTADKVSLRERIRAERSVELCFEAQRWHDIRRWHVAHLPEYKALYALDFDQEHTSFSKSKIMDRVFTEKHYWLPLPEDEVQLYEGYNQNPGW